MSNPTPYERVKAAVDAYNHQSYPSGISFEEREFQRGDRHAKSTASLVGWLSALLLTGRAVRAEDVAEGVEYALAVPGVVPVHVTGEAAMLLIGGDAA